MSYVCSFTSINRQRGNEIKQWLLAFAKVARKGRPIIHFKINIQVRSPAEHKEGGVSNSPDKILKQVTVSNGRCYMIYHCLASMCYS